MNGHHDVHVYPNRELGRWTVEQGGRELSRHLLQATAVKVARRTARRDHVEVVVHGRDGRIREKDSSGRESARPDTEH